jgi:hypothetical protein
VGSAIELAAQETGAFQDLDVLRSPGQRHGKRRRQLADAALSHGEATEHRAARWIGQRVEDPVEIGWRLRNHLVE